jgi:hypothetical protein
MSDSAGWVKMFLLFKVGVWAFWLTPKHVKLGAWSFWFYHMVHDDLFSPLITLIK